MSSVNDKSSAARSMAWLFAVLLVLGMLFKRARSELNLLEQLIEEKFAFYQHGLLGIVAEWMGRNSVAIQGALSFALTAGALAWAVWRWGGRSIRNAMLAIALFAAARSFYSDYVGPLTGWLPNLISYLPSGVMSSGWRRPIEVLTSVLMAPWTAAILTFQLFAGLALTDGRLRRSAPWWILFFLLAVLSSFRLSWIISWPDAWLRQAGAGYAPLSRIGLDVGLQYALQAVAIAIAYRAAMISAPADGEAQPAGPETRFLASAGKLYLVASILLVLGLTAYVAWLGFSHGGVVRTPVR